jgi:hypothetical protein
VKVPVRVSTFEGHKLWVERYVMSCAFTHPFKVIDKVDAVLSPLLL